jgi:hypothetical protein
MVAISVSGCLDTSKPLHVTPQIQNGTAGPGLWRSLGGDDCTGWGQYTTYKGSWEHGDHLQSHSMYDGPVDAQIIDANGRFSAPGCASFWLVGGPWDRPLATPGQPFGPGDYRVGYEVAPGTYVAPGEPNTPDARPCVWMRVSAFRFNTFETVIESHNYFGPVTPGNDPGPQIVTIDEHDFGFSSYGCGPWSKIG